MAQSLLIAIWYANELSKHSELKTFTQNNNIDIMIISKIHFASKSYLPSYTLYIIHDSNRITHEGSGVLVRNTIRHHKFRKRNQA